MMLIVYLFIISVMWHSWVIYFNADYADIFKMQIVDRIKNWLFKKSCQLNDVLGQLLWTGNTWLLHVSSCPLCDWTAN